MSANPIFRLYTDLCILGVDSPSGSTAVDADIASVLSVSSLPYTSNSTDAQTLLPSGWSWSTSSGGSIICVRNSDSVTVGGLQVSDGTGTEVSVPAPLGYCIAALAAYSLEDTNIS